MMTTREKIQIIGTLEDCDAEELRIMAPIRGILEAEAPYLVGAPAANLRATLDIRAAKAEAHAGAMAAKAATQCSWEAHALEVMARGNAQAAW